MPHADPDIRRVYHREYKAAHRPQTHASNNASYARNRDAILARRAARRAQETPEQRAARLAKARVYTAAYAAPRREQINAKTRETRRADVERARLAEAKWRANSRDLPSRRALVRKHRHLRRARLRNAAIGPIDYAALVVRDGGRCHLCGLPVAEPEQSFDHLIPLSRGGPHVAWNLRLTHLACNIRRGVSGPAQLLLPL
jgi:5-methylcytosine-specific restriction endonuclease McrA